MTSIINRVIGFIFRPTRTAGEGDTAPRDPIGTLVRRKLNYSKSPEQTPIQERNITVSPKEQEVTTVETPVSRAFNDPKKSMLERSPAAMHRYLYGHVLDKKNLHPHIERGWGLQSLHLAKALNDFAQQLDSPAEIALFQQCGEQLKEAVSMTYLAPSNPSAVSQHVYQKIQRLKVGESYLIHGYWGNDSKNHAVSYEIVCTEEGFILSIINTGDDENSFLTRVDSIVDKFERKYSHLAFNLPSISPDLIKTLLGIGEEKGKKSKEETLGTIKSICTQLGGKEERGRIHHPQNRGSCAQKRDKSWLKEKFIRELGPIEGNRLYEQFKIHYSKQLMGEVNAVESTMSDEELQKLYASPSHHTAISERRQACEETVRRQEKKLKRFEVYAEFKANGWNLTDEEFSELNRFIYHLQRHNKDPMEICQKALEWKGEKNWRHWRNFEEISDRLKSDDWPLTDQEYHELAMLMRRFEEMKKKPVVIIGQINEEWRGDKSWNRLRNVINNYLSLYESPQELFQPQEEKSNRFNEVLNRLKEEGWDLTGQEKGLAMLVEDFERRGKDPMELCQLDGKWKEEIENKIEQIKGRRELQATRWKGKNWRHLRHLAVYDRLQTNGWNLTGPQLGGLASLVKDFEDAGKKPMELCEIAENWKGEKDWRDLQSTLILFSMNYS